MPSGAKRRKAAKKKKEKIANSSTSSQQQGNGYSPKSHDDKDSHSDSGDNDTSSPSGSQDHQNPFSREQSEEKSEVLGEPQSVEIEKSQLGVGGDGEDEVVTKEVDIESVKESDVEAVKGGEKGGFGGSLGSEESEVVEKKSGEFEPPQKEEFSKSNGGGNTKEIDVLEIDIAVEPIDKVVSLTKELIHEPGKQIVVQSEEVVQAVEVVQAGDVNHEKKTGDRSGTDLLLNDREGDVLPTSNGAIVVAVERLSENQRKDLASVPPTIRPTSWKSCCGLFDVLTGSNT